MRQMIAMACLLAMAAASFGEEVARVQISVLFEEGHKLIVATVTRGGKPAEGAKVVVGVARTFGRLNLGAEETLDDGTAAVPFPEGLPGGPEGKLRVVAEVVAPADLVGARAESLLDGGVVVKVADDPFPAALWSPRAPMALVSSILACLALVWCVYAYVLSQLVRIRMEEQR